MDRLKEILAEIDAMLEYQIWNQSLDSTDKCSKKIEKILEARADLMRCRQKLNFVITSRRDW